MPEPKESGESKRTNVEAHVEGAVEAKVEENVRFKYLKISKSGSCGSSGG